MKYSIALVLAMSIAIAHAIPVGNLREDLLKRCDEDAKKAHDAINTHKHSKQNEHDIHVLSVCEYAFHTIKQQISFVHSDDKLTELSKQLEEYEERMNKSIEHLDKSHHPTTKKVSVESVTDKKHLIAEAERLIKHAEEVISKHQEDLRKRPTIVELKEQIKVAQNLIKQIEHTNEEHVLHALEANLQTHELVMRHCIERLEKSNLIQVGDAERDMLIKKAQNLIKMAKEYITKHPGDIQSIMKIESEMAKIEALILEIKNCKNEKELEHLKKELEQHERHLDELMGKHHASTHHFTFPTLPTLHHLKMDDETTTMEPTTHHHHHHPTDGSTHHHHHHPTDGSTHHHHHPTDGSTHHHHHPTDGSTHHHHHHPTDGSTHHHHHHSHPTTPMA